MLEGGGWGWGRGVHYHFAWRHGDLADLAWLCRVWYYLRKDGCGVGWGGGRGIGEGVVKIAYLSYIEILLE
jgi:hypothetical protein